MSNIDKQWLQQKIADMEARRDDPWLGLDEDDSNTLAALRIALASLEAEIHSYTFEDDPRPLYTAPPAPVVPAELHPDTQKLVIDFCTVLAEKLYKAQLKYGYDADWKQDGWPTQCQAHFHQHIAKGDPRDVAAYCAFMWYHGWKTEPAPVSVPDEATPENIEILASTYAPSGITYQWDRDECNAAADSWNSCRAAMLQGAEKAESPTTMHTAPALDSSPKIAESPSGINQGKSEPVTTACKLRDAVEIIRNSGIEIDAEKIFAERDALNAPDCWCRTCRPVTISDMRFVVCPECGNKRCPHANDHQNACTGSNEPGQEGSAYPAAPQQEDK